MPGRLIKFNGRLCKAENLFFPHNSTRDAFYLRLPHSHSRIFHRYKPVLTFVYTHFMPIIYMTLSMFFNFRCFKRHFLRRNIGRVKYRRRHVNCRRSVCAFPHRTVALVRVRLPVHRRALCVLGFIRRCLCARAADKTYAVMSERRRSTVRGTAEGGLRR